MSHFNPHHPNAAEVFDAADKFKQRCLLDQESLFLDGQTLWTADHFQALIDNYVKQPDVGDGGFYDKLVSQLATYQALDVALMAEVFWIVQLGPTNLRAPTKAKTLERIWNMKPAVPFPSTSPFLATPVLSGLGSAGPGYNQYLWMDALRHPSLTERGRGMGGVHCSPSDEGRVPAHGVRPQPGAAEMRGV